jgi:CRP-like cAMP-binding protein
MHELLFEHINKKISLSKSDEEFLKTVFIPKKLRKRQYLLQEGEINKYNVFVSKGCLRIYSIDEAGKEHVVQFAIEDWWIGDMYSFLTGEPSVYNIDALEDSELLLMDRKMRESVFQRIPAYEKFMRITLENNYVATQRRINAMMSKTAEEKYLAFVNAYPQILQRVPQHMVASYLGLTPETLSRIRKHLLEKKQR